MKDVNEILNDDKIKIIWRNIKNEKAIQLKLTVESPEGKDALVKFTRALGWEHLSVSFEDETPSWDFMQCMKELFWKDDEVCFQLHPSKDEYINNHEYCLHIWRPLNYDLTLPPTILVGFRAGHEDEDKIELLKVQEELGSPITEKEADMMIKFSKIKGNDEDKLNYLLNNISPIDILRLL